MNTDALDATEDTPESRRYFLFQDLLRLFLIGVLFGIAALLFRNTAIRSYLSDILTVGNTFHVLSLVDNPSFGVPIFICTSSALIGLGVPRIWISAVAGGTYGVLTGSIVAMIASLFGSAAVYLMGRSFLGSLAQRRFGKHFQTWSMRFRQDAFWWVLWARLFPLSNATLTSLLCGSCKVSFKAFFLGSLIGFLPMTLLFAFFGSGSVRGNMLHIGFGLAAILLTVLAKKWAGTYMRPSQSTGTKVSV